MTKRGGILSLAGFMGCGKSTVGQELARLLSMDFIDLDDYIVKREGCSIPEIFADGGEPAFRRIELAALKDILEDVSCASKGAFHTCHSEQSEESAKHSAGNNSIVLSLGGGTLTTPECASLVNENTTCIYLRATTETLVDNLLKGGYSGRPMLGKADAAGKSGHDSKDEKAALRSQIEGLMSRRKSIYEACSHFIIDIDGKSPRSIAKEIIICHSEPKAKESD